MPRVRWAATIPKPRPWWSRRCGPRASTFARARRSSASRRWRASCACTSSTIHGFETIDGSPLLIALGRTPNLSDLNLDCGRYQARARRHRRSIAASERRTGASTPSATSTVARASNHAASYQAEIVLKRALFWMPAKANKAIVPYGHDDRSGAGARGHERGRGAGGAASGACSAVAVLGGRPGADRSHSRRAMRRSSPAAKGRFSARPSSGPAASELIQVWSLAVAEKLHVKAMAAHVVPLSDARGSFEARRCPAFLPAAREPQGPQDHRSAGQAWLARRVR